MRKLLALPMALALTVSASAQMLEEIVVKVNDQIVTKTEFETRLHQTLEGLKREYKGPDLDARLAEVPRRLLDQVTEELLLVEKARQIYNVDSIVDFQVENFMKENKFATKEDLAKALAGEGLTMEKFRKQVTMIFVPEFIKSREVRSKIQLSSEEISSFYEAHKGDLVQKEQVELQEIFLPQKSYTEDKATAIYEQIQRELAAGKDFGDLASLHSEAYSRNNKGRTGFFARGDLSAELSQPVFSMAEGKVTPLIATTSGWYIFKVLSRKAGKMPTLEEAHDAVVEALKEQKFEKAYGEYLQVLRGENFVRLNPKYI